jgi:SNF2 family DNA or RNA helicase
VPAPRLLAQKGNRAGRLLIKFIGYDPKLKAEVEEIPGARFIGPGKGGPGFTIQWDMQTCVELRRKFPDRIDFTEEVLAWGHEQRSYEQKLLAIASKKVNDAPLDNFRRKVAGRKVLDRNDKSPTFGQMVEIWDLFREDQKIGVEYWCQADNPLIADDMGLGKTWEVIAGILESDQEQGFNLVIAPKVAIENVWLEELNAFQDEMVFVAPEGKRQRDKLLKEVQMCLDEEIPFWLVVNPAMVGLRRTQQEGDEGIYDHISGRVLQVQFPFLFNVTWTNIIVDESQDSGLANPSSQFSRAITMMKSNKRTAMSGTPLGGKPARLWGTLHWLEPTHFSSKKTWSDRWIKSRTFDNPVTGREVTVHTTLKGDLEEEFYKEHRRYILRRTKADVFTDRLKPNPVDIWVHMEPQQERQYKLMEEEAFMNIYESEQEVGRVSMANVLVVDAWLKQFANGYCDLEEKSREWNEFLDAWDIKYKAIPTYLSPKMEAMWQYITTVGADDPDTGEQVVIFTQFKGWADCIVRWLREESARSASRSFRTSRLVAPIKRSS